MNRRSLSHPETLPLRARVSQLTFLPAAIVTCALLSGAVGCKSASPDDAALTTAVTSQINGDSSLAGQQVQTSVQNGIVTLNGGVQNDAQRTIAARDAASVQGVKQVLNNLTLASAMTSATAPAPLPVERSRVNETMSRNRPETAREPYDSRSPQPQQPYNPAPVSRTPPPSPAFQTVTLPSDSPLPVRVTQTLDSATTQPGESFSGVIASDVVVDGLVVIPAGSAVTGNVDAVQEAAHFKGNSLLTISLTGIKDRSDRLPVSTGPYTVTGKGRGKNTAEKAGGGAAVGAVLGGIFGGGKGAAIGAGVGGGAGLGANALTRGQQVQIPSETIVRFRTTSPITVRVRSDSASQSNSANPSLQQRPY